MHSSIPITVVFFCHDGKGNVLLNFRSHKCRDEHHRWDSGGGRLQFGESVEEALLRELKEEYCTTPISFTFLGYRDLFRQGQDGKKNHWLSLDFKVLVDPTKVKNGEPDKLEKLAWFPLQKLPTPLHSQLPIFLERHKQSIF